MAGPAVKWTKQQDRTQELYALFGGANFADILNRLWMMGKDPNELQRALAQTPEGTNDPTDIIVRLINEGIATPEEIREAPALPVPEGVQWAFGPENVVDGVVKPWHTEAFRRPLAGPGNPPRGIPFPTPSPPEGQTQPQQPAPPPQQMGGLGGPGGGGLNIQQIVNQALSQATAEGRDVTVEEADDIIQRAYGFSAMALDIPEIRAILEQAANEDWDEPRLRGAIQATGWWKRTTDAERGWTALEKQDPATAERRVAGQVTSLRGIVATKGFDIPEDRLRRIAELSLRYGWNTDEVNRAIGSEFRYDPTGEKSSFVRGIETMAGDYAVPLSKAAIESWGQQMLSGTATEEDFKGYLTDYARGLFPALGSALDRGMSVRQFVDPYVQIAANALELTPNEINISDPKWLRAINQIDPKTGDRTVMSLSDWETTLKTDKQYGYNRTKQAKKNAAAVGTRILEMFGAR